MLLSPIPRKENRNQFIQTMDLKLKNPSLKVLLAVGGWNMGSTEFSIMVHDNDLRSKFVRTAITFLQKNKYLINITE